jgi:hypothetical protein
VAIVATCALSVTGVALAAPGEVIQTLDVGVSPTKLPQSGGKNAKLRIAASTCFEGAAAGQCRSEPPQVPELVRVLLSLDRKDIDINPGAAKQCKASPDAIADQSPAAATAACGAGSVVGKGQAVYNFGLSDLQADVTVFNGRKQGARPVILLHAFVGEFQQGTVSIGVLRPRNKLDITIDPLAPGFSRLASFNVTIKKGAYVQARCTRGREIATTSRWSYGDAPETTVPASDRCRVKR